MNTRVALVVGIALSLTGCIMPTPMSVVSMGVDAISFVATGKAATDHGVSLAMGEDCALIRIFEGQICQKPRVFEPTEAGIPLEPLPDSIDSAQLAAAHPEVRAAIVRSAQYEGWASDSIQLALLPGGFVADDFESLTAPLPAREEAEAAPLTFGELLTSIAEDLDAYGAEGYREPVSRADGGRTPSLTQEQHGPVATQAASWPRSGTSHEVGERPMVPAFGALSNLEAAQLAARLTGLRRHGIDG